MHYLSGGIMTTKEIENAISGILAKNKDYKRNQAYYNGNNPTITNKPRQEKPDIRISIPIAKKAIGTVGGYSFREMEYKAMENDDAGQTMAAQDYQDQLDAVLQFNESSLETLELFNECATQGAAYELHWFGQESELPEFGLIPGRQGMMIYSRDVKPKPLYFYRTISYTIGDDEVTDFYVYDALSCEVYRREGDKDFKMIPEESFTHAYGEIPAIEYKIDAEGQNLFYHVTDLIDELDRLYSSNIGNELSKISASLLMTNRYLSELTTLDDHGRSGTQTDEMLDGRKWVLDGIDKQAGDFFEWLEKNAPADFVFGSADRIERLTYDQLEIPNFSDTEKWGNNVSGVAAAYRLIGFNNLCNHLFSYFSKGLYQRVKLINKMFSQMPGMTSIIPQVKIEPVKQMPKNILENSTIARNLMGIAPKSDILKLFPTIVEDATESAALAIIEKEKESLALMGGVSEPTL